MSSEDEMVDVVRLYVEKDERLIISATPYRWPDPAKIPPRQFLFGRHYARKTISATIGAPGRAKTTLDLTEFVGMACGCNLLTDEEIKPPLRVWYLNGEEDQDELDRRVAAICKRYGVTKADCGGRLFVQSVRDKPIRFAILDKNGRPVLNRDALDQFEAEIRKKRIDVFGLDPLISFHAVSENLNEHMDLVLKEGLGGVASRTNSGGEVCHHPSKPKPGQSETTVEEARGASAIIAAVRAARVLNFMTPEEAKQLGIAEDNRRLHVRVTNGKANMGPLGKATWFKLEVENLPNGDEIACASSWKPPDPFQGVSTADMHKCRTLAQTGAYRLDSRADDWVGYMVADVLGINVARGVENDPKDLARIKQILHTWFKNKVLTTEQRRDHDTRHKRTFVVPGPWTDEQPITADLDDEVTLQ
jgi:AAA domain